MSSAQKAEVILFIAADKLFFYRFECFAGYAVEVGQEYANVGELGELDCLESHWSHEIMRRWR